MRICRIFYVCLQEKESIAFNTNNNIKVWSQINRSIIIKIRSLSYNNRRDFIFIFRQATRNTLLILWICLKDLI